MYGEKRTKREIVGDFIDENRNGIMAGIIAGTTFGIGYCVGFGNARTLVQKSLRLVFDEAPELEKPFKEAVKKAASKVAKK